VLIQALTELPPVHLAIAGAGRNADAYLALAAELGVADRVHMLGALPASDIADLYAGLGEKDEVFRWLNAAYEERDYQMEGLKTDPLLDPLHSDPRFAELVRKVGLPQ